MPELTDEMRMAAYRAARRWAVEHRHPRPDDRMIDAAVTAVLVEPHRGDEVEVWIKRARDACFSAIGAGPSWYALDDLLDDYRLHADAGAALSVPVEEIGPRDA